MAKTMTITYNGEAYTLEFTRRSVERMEQSGFNVAEIRTKPVSTLPTLFAGAFIAHHRGLKPQIIDEIFESLPDKELLLQKLSEMYAEPIESLFSEPESDAGNASWEVSW